MSILRRAVLPLLLLWASSLTGCGEGAANSARAGGEGASGSGANGTGAAGNEPRSPLLHDTLAELPQQLSDIGLYPGLPSLAAAAPALEYEPGYELWSDGGEKHRSIVIPEGTTIDAADPEWYEFPVGTLIFKTFAFRTPSSPALSVPVETRLLRLTDEGWEFAAYSWNDAGTDAELLDLKRAVTRQVLTGSDGLIDHSIPSRLECRQCHESAPGAVLGLSELQLAQSASFEALSGKLEPRPREPYAALPEHGPLTTKVLGYLVGNCVHCHNGTNGAASSFDLRPAVALQNLINQPTASSATADGIRVSPGIPEESVMLLALRGGGDFEVKDMPPLGVAERDANAIGLLEDWIHELGQSDDP